MYIHDYLVKRDLKASAQAFQAEGKVSSDPVGMYILNLNVQEGVIIFEFQHLRFQYIVLYHSCHFNWFVFLAFWFAAIDAPGGFLFEWWSVFWDIFIARTNEKHSEVAASYIEVCGRIFSCILIACTVVTIYAMVLHLQKLSYCRFKNAGDLGCIISSP